MIVIFPLKMVIVPLKVVIFPLKMVMFPLKVVMFPLKMLMFPLKMVMFPLKMVMFPLKKMVIFPLVITRKCSPALLHVRKNFCLSRLSILGLHSMGLSFTSFESPTQAPTESMPSHP